MSYLYQTGLSAVVNASLAFSSKQFSVREPLPTLLQELEDAEELGRTSIEYDMLMRSEVLYIQFRQRKFASFSPKRPDAKRRLGNDGGDGGNNNNSVLQRSDSGSGVAFPFGRSDSMSSMTSSFSDSTTSSVLDMQLAEQLAAAGEDEIDVRIAQMQNRREREGKRRLRYQKQHDHAWSGVKKQAPFDNLYHVERESRLDIQDIELEMAAPIEEEWLSSMLTAKMYLQIEEMKARALLVAEQVDANADAVQMCLELDDLLEEYELRRVCEAESVKRERRPLSGSRPCSAASGSSGAGQQQPTPPASSPAATAAETLDDDVISSASLTNVMSGVPPPPREPMGVPTFQSLRPQKNIKNINDQSGRPPRSDDDIVREMRIRKERYRREELAREEAFAWAAIRGHFREVVPGPEVMAPRYPHGSIEERIANAHRVDLRPPR